MADTIYLNPGEFSARTLSKAKSDIDKAVARTGSANDSAASAYYYFDGLPYSLFTGEIGSLVAQAYLNLTEAQAQIEALSKIIKTGPDSLESIDKARKSDLTTWLDRTVYDAKTTIEIIKSGFIGFITGLFSSGSASTGGETNVPTVGNSDGIISEVSEEQLAQEDYLEYREIVDIVNEKAAPTRIQLYKLKNDYKSRKGNDKKEVGLCNVSSAETLLNRRLAFEGKSGQFSDSDIFNALDVTVKEGPINWKGTGENGYTLDGGTGSWAANKVYTSPLGDSYTMTNISSAQIKKDLPSNDMDGFCSYLAGKLNEHPEGICLRNNYSSNTGGHVIVVTDYEIVDEKIKLWVSDPADATYGKLREPLEESYFYKNCKNSKGSLLSTLDFIAYLKY